MQFSDLSHQEDMVEVISLEVLREHVKFVKSKLEQQGLLNKSVQIRSVDSQGGRTQSADKRYIIGTNIRTDFSGQRDQTEDSLINNLGLQNIAEAVSICTTIASGSEMARKGRSQVDPVAAAFHTWLSNLPARICTSLDNCNPKRLATAFTGYCIYEPMLLLPVHFSNSHEMSQLLLSCGPTRTEDLYSSLAACTGTTHVAANAPIPRHQQTASEAPLQREGCAENFLRSPTGLRPLHGDFGPLVTHPSPTDDDFARALWVSTKQNGVKQVWAPRYTMFSRGNVKEKIRIRNLESVRSDAGEGCTAVDLYAGIGYFAFSYAKAGVKKVLCFELNPWSVEGLKRGAALNGCEAQVVREKDVGESWDAEPLVRDEKTRFLVFQMDNARAADVVKTIGPALPPIRHVNCGLLPSSKGSWKTALAVVDHEAGGWLHIHELIKETDIDRVSLSVLDEVQALVGRNDRELRLEHVEKVKSYAPGIIHCVLDIYVSGITEKSC